MRSSLRMSTLCSEVHSRAVVLFPAPECPTNKLLAPSGPTTPTPCSSIAPLLREAMHNQEFVDRVSKWLNRFPQFRRTFFTQLEHGLAEAFVSN